MRDRTDRLPLALVVILALTFALGHCGARAQERDELHVHDDTLRDLVRITAHEAGLDSPADADGIWSVWVRGAEREGMSIDAFAHAYSRRAFAGTDRAINQWAMELELDCGAPPSLHLPWDRVRAGGEQPRRDACLALVAHAREVVSSPLVCEADDWGNARDYERRRRLGYPTVMVSCAPGARNLFSRRGGR